MLFKNKKQLSNQITIEKYMEYLKAEATCAYNPKLATKNQLSKGYAKRIYNVLNFMKERNLLAASGEVLDMIRTYGKLVDSKKVLGKNTEYEYVLQLNLPTEAQNKLEEIEYKLLLVPVNTQEVKENEDIREN